MAYIIGQVRRQRLSDRHVGVREQRRLPLLVGIVSVLLGVAVLVLGQAPRELVALVAAMAVGSRLHSWSRWHGRSRSTWRWSTAP